MWIDADELDQKTRNTGQNQVIVKNFAAGFGAAQRFCSHVPEKRGNGEPDEKFIERRGVHAAVGRPAPLHAGFGGGNHTLRERHPPWPVPGRGLTVVAVSGKQAADSADRVTHARRGRTNIQKQQQRNFQAARHDYKRQKSAEKSAEPCKTKATEQQIPRVSKEFGGTFQNVIEPRTDEASDSRHANDEKAFVALPFVARDALELRAPAIEIPLQHVGGDEQRGSHHQAEGGNSDWAEMQKRNHKLNTRVYTAAAASP